MKKLVILGCGYLGNIVADAVINGLLPEYDLVGVYARTKSKALYIANKMQAAGRECKACSSFEELLALKPDFLAEAASPAAMKETAIATLKNGTSIVTISVGALADNLFKAEVERIAKSNGTKVYICSGATGGFDVLRTAALMGKSTANFFNENGRHRSPFSPFYRPGMENEKQIIFSGTAREAINIFPTGLNVAVAASIASVGPEQMHVTMQTTPRFIGDIQRVEIKNEQVHAVVDVYSATSEIAGWSIVSTLQNIASPIVF
ncbi:MAG: aspartate dehydrogenase [Bacteroidales bacterium 36-12]|nr:MAG: aspartate dehydrogenase [Bacteroidales bacterium 36-12]